MCLCVRVSVSVRLASALESECLGRGFSGESAKLCQIQLFVDSSRYHVFRKFVRMKRKSFVMRIYEIS